LDVGFFVYLHDGSMFMHIFVYIWMRSSFPGSRPNEPITRLRLLSDSRP